MNALGRVWLAAAALGAGAFLGDIHPSGSTPLAVALASAAVLLRRRSVSRAAAIAALCFALGWLSASARAGRISAVEVLARGAPRCELAGRVLEGAGGLGTLAAVDRAACSSQSPIGPAGVVVFDQPAPAGSRFSGEGHLLPLGTDAFDMARRRLGAEGAWEPARLSLAPPPPGPFRVAAAIRQGLAAASRSLGRRGALLRGLALGDTADIAPSTIEAFRRSGLSHLLAVSGSNVAIVLAAVGLLVIGLPLRVRVVAGAAALALFVVVVGPEPSVLRAAAMGGVALVALALGRRVEPLQGLGLAVVAVIGVRPQMVFSVGLQLSIAATAGLIVFSAPLSQRIHFVRPVGLALAATFGAQLAVAPVLIATFGELSLIAPLANVLALPAVPPATVLGLAGAVIGAVDPRVGGVIVGLAGPFVSWILFCGEKFAEPGWATAEMGRGWAFALSAVVLIAAWLTLRRRP